MNAKTLLVSLALVAFLPGCGPRPSSQQQQAVDYATINDSMTRDQVYRLIGRPQGTDSRGREHWQATIGTQDEQLWLGFDPEGKITEIEKRIRQSDVHVGRP